MIITEHRGPSPSKQLASEFTSATVRGYGFNGQVPGPVLEAKQGVPLEIEFTNRLPEPTVIHWHGLRIPAAMDGTEIVQDPVRPRRPSVQMHMSVEDRSQIIDSRRRDVGVVDRARLEIDSARAR